MLGLGLGLDHNPDPDPTPRGYPLQGGAALPHLSRGKGYWMAW